MTWYNYLFGNYNALNRHLRLQNLLPILRNVTNSVVLDIGCLDGAMTKYLIGRSNIVFAVDITDNAIVQSFPQINFVVSKGESLPFQDNCFDFVLCSDVFEHVSNFEDIIPEIARVLKPGKSCLISTVNGVYESPIKIRSWIFGLPVSVRDMIMGDFCMSDIDFHVKCMGHVRLDLDPDKVVKLFKLNMLNVIRQGFFCKGGGSLLLDIFYTFNKGIRILLFPLFRLLLPIDSVISFGKPWQYYILFNK